MALLIDLIRFVPYFSLIFTNAGKINSNPSPKEPRMARLIPAAERILRARKLIHRAKLPTGT